MENNVDQDLDIDDINLVIDQARRYRSEAAGDLIACGSCRALARMMRWADRFLHAFLMSPTTQR